MDEVTRAARRKSNLIAAGIIVAGVLLAATCVNRDDEKATPEDQRAIAAAAVDVSAQALAQAFRDNEVAAEARFGGKPLRVTGTVVAIGLNDVGQPWLGLGPGPDVLAVLGEDQSSAVALLSKGEEATVLCTEMLTIEGTHRLDGCELGQAAARTADPSGG